MGLKAWIEGYIIGKGIKRAVHFIVAAVVGYMTSAKVAPLLASWGVTVDPVQLKQALTMIIGGAFAAGLNWLKFKTGLKFLQ